jgi:hypothetical protein
MGGRGGSSGDTAGDSGTNNSIISKTRMSDYESGFNRTADPPTKTAYIAESTRLKQEIARNPAGAREMLEQRERDKSAEVKNLTHARNRAKSEAEDSQLRTRQLTVAGEWKAAEILLMSLRRK